MTLSVVDSFAPPAAAADDGAEAELASGAAAPAAPPLSFPDIVTKSTSHTALMHCSNHYGQLFSAPNTKDSMFGTEAEFRSLLARTSRPPDRGQGKARLLDFPELEKSPAPAKQRPCFCLSCLYFLPEKNAGFFFRIQIVPG